MSPKLPLLYLCRNPERQTGCRGRPEKESRPRGGAWERSHPTRKSKGHAMTRKASERGSIEHRKTLLSGLEFRASGSRGPRILRQRAISQRRARKSLINTEMIRHPLRRGGDACVSPAGTLARVHLCCGYCGVKMLGRESGGSEQKSRVPRVPKTKIAEGQRCRGRRTKVRGTKLPGDIHR